MFARSVLEMRSAMTSQNSCISCGGCIDPDVSEYAWETFGSCPLISKPNKHRTIALKLRMGLTDLAICEVCLLDVTVRAYRSKLNTRLKMRTVTDE